MNIIKILRNTNNNTTTTTTTNNNNNTDLSADGFRARDPRKFHIGGCTGEKTLAFELNKNK